MKRALEYFPSEVPEGSAGLWVVEKILIADRPYDRDADPRPDCFKFRPGRYTSLRRGAEQFMTDLYDEWWTQREAIEQALVRGGDILITGLGLGLVGEAILRVEGSRVSRVTIVELSSEVISLVGPYMNGRYPGRVEIVNANAFEWTPPRGRRFTVGWHDIWPTPFGSVVESEIEALQKRYEPFCDWQGSWPHAYQEALPMDTSVTAFDDHRLEQGSLNE